MRDNKQMQRLLDRPDKPGLRTALAMKNVGEVGDGEDKFTFDFRHFQSTLDPELAKQWVRICVALVLAAKGLGEYNSSLTNMTYNRFYLIGNSRTKPRP